MSDHDVEVSDDRVLALLALLATFGVSLRSLEQAAFRAASRGDSAALLRVLRRLEVRVQADLLSLADESADWIEQELPGVYEAGAVAALAALGSAEVFAWSAARSGALSGRQDDLWGAASTAIRFAGNDTSRFVGDLRRAAGRVGSEGSALNRAESFRRVVREMRSRGLATVTYSNGARYPIEAHLSTLFNTHTTLTRADASIREWNRLDVKFVQLSDGPNCGLFDHRGLPLAAGMVIPIELYEAFPISHPNCVRQATPMTGLVAGPDGEPIEVPEDADAATLVLREASAVLESASREIEREVRR